MSGVSGAALSSPPAHGGVLSAMNPAPCCPSCGQPSSAGTGGWSTCRCGRSWPVHAAEVPPEPLDVLSAAALPLDRLRNYLHGPVTPAERAEARRRLDRLAADRWSTR